MSIDQNIFDPFHASPQEPELQGPAPRKARFKGKTIALRYITLNVAIAALVFAQWRVSANLRELRELAASGKVVPAIVASKTESHGKTTTYYIGYRFKPEGQIDWVSDADQVPEYQYDEATIGAQTPVTYMPSRPEEHRLGFVGPERVAKTQRLATIGMTLASLLSLALLVGGEWYLQSRLRLMREGIATVGEIVDHKIVRSKNVIYKLVYRYWLPDGDLVYGEESVSRALFDRLRDNDPLTVLYVARYPKSGVPYVSLDEVEVVC